MIRGLESFRSKAKPGKGEKVWIMKCRQFAARRKEIGILVQHEVKHQENPPLVERVMIPLFATGYHPFGVHHVNGTNSHL